MRSHGVEDQRRDGWIYRSGGLKRSLSSFMMLEREESMYIKRAIAATVLALTVGAVAALPASAATGPEGVPVTQGAYYSDVYVGSVHTPLSLPYVWLDRGKTWSFGNVDLVLQSDSNLVMYRHGNHGIVYWKSNTVNSGATQLILQHDGNLVLYTSGYAKAVWASNTSGKCSGYDTPALSIQSDSNLVVYCADKLNSAGSLWALSAAWSTHTNGV
jgi:hypothetical protein